jgi:hypothetical protein
MGWVLYIASTLCSNFERRFCEDKDMEYKDLRRKFVEMSGRYDLVNANWTDNGADFFINAGQKHLDRMLDLGKSKARLTKSLTAGTVLVTTTGLRAIKEVWVSNSSGMYELFPQSIANLRAYYAGKFSEATAGAPEYYAPAVLRPFPDTTVAADIAGFYDIEDLILHVAIAGTGHWTYNGIVVMPPADGTYTLSLWGLFYSPTLLATLSGSTWTQTKSFWTEEHPETLLMAALYKLEVFYRNTEGAKDWSGAMKEDMLGMDHDFVEEDLNGPSQIGG